MEQNLAYTKQRFIAASAMDCTAKMGIANAVVLVQDNLTECFGRLKIDNYEFKKNYNAFWAFTKNRIHFERRPNWMEHFTATTFPVNNTGFRTNVHSLFTDAEGKLMFSSNIECCCLDFEKHRPMRLSLTNFPKEGFPEPGFTDSFEKFNTEFTDEDFVFEQQVRSQHTDMSGHMNNTEYVKLAMGAFSADFLNCHEPRDLEVHYTGESRENQVLRVYSRQVEDGFMVKITESDRCVFEMGIWFSNI